MVVVIAGAVVGVTVVPAACNDAVTVIVPAVVPVIRRTLCCVPKTACVVPAGMVKLAVNPPLENWIAGSVAPTAEVNTAVRVPVSGTV